MDIFVARRPIYDLIKQVCAYELLYKEDKENYESAEIEENSPKSKGVADAIGIFGLDNITNGNRAFISFTKEAILGDLPLSLEPDGIVIEVSENMEMGDEVIKKLNMLRTRGYMTALDSYKGDKKLDPILKHMDIIQVDFFSVEEEAIGEIANRLGKNKNLLASGIETEEDFAKAIRLGFTYFKGHYFSKPKIEKGKTVKLNAMSYGEIIAELGKLSPDFVSLSKVIGSNPDLTFKLLQHANTLRFIQKERVTSIHSALINMGINEVRRWILIMLAMEFSKDKQLEIIKTSFIRAIFMEKIAAYTSFSDRANEVFLMGLLSMLDTISGVSIEKLVEEIPVNDDVKKALTGEETGDFKRLLDFAEYYEQGYWELIDHMIKELSLSREIVSKTYLECVIMSEMIFRKKTIAS